VDGERCSKYHQKSQVSLRSLHFSIRSEHSGHNSMLIHSVTPRGRQGDHWFSHLCGNVIGVSVQQNLIAVKLAGRR